MNGAPARAGPHVQVMAPKSTIEVAASKKSEPWTKCSNFTPCKCSLYRIQRSTVETGEVPAPC